MWLSSSGRWQSGIMNTCQKGSIFSGVLATLLPVFFLSLPRINEDVKEVAVGLSEEVALVIDHNNLEEFADAENYDIEESGETGVAFYRALAQETGGPVLEIACGTGRVAIPIAGLGLAVTGLDIVPGMLAQARRKSAGLPARWVEGDGRSFDLGEPFGLIYLTGNAFMAFLTRVDQEAVLARVWAHLRDDGLFAFETRNPRWAALGPLGRGGDEGFFTLLETREEEEDWGRYTDKNGREVRLSGTQRYEHVAQVLHWTTYRRWDEGGQEQTKITRIAVRFTFPQELEALLHYNGFAIERQYGNWNEEPLTAASPSIITVCRKVNHR
jgi:SAM-dependent methyltransferase